MHLHKQPRLNLYANRLVRVRKVLALDARVWIPACIYVCMYIRNLQIFSVCFSQYPKCILKLQALHFTFHFINTTYFIFYLFISYRNRSKPRTIYRHWHHSYIIQYNRSCTQLICLCTESPKRFSLVITHTYVCHIYRELLRKLFSFKINTLYLLAFHKSISSNRVFSVWIFQNVSFQFTMFHYFI